MAAELASLRERFIPRLAWIVAASREAGIENIAACLLAARELLTTEKQNFPAVAEGFARKGSLDP